RSEQRLDRVEAAVEKLVQAQARSEQRLDRVEAAVEKLVQAQSQLTRQVQSLSDNIGFGLEDVARTMLPPFLQRHHGISMGEFERQFFTVDDETLEIDLYAEATQGDQPIVILGEVKSRIYSGDVEKFVRRVDKVAPLVASPIRKVMFGFFIHPSATEMAKRTETIVVASYQR
ncbi:MAG TPA: hypothetical protein GX513_06350, partial [Firmicutes bacterium]|nr:hypothetical protein [Bacillota bacterium]